MSISLPPRPPELDDLRPLDQEALIKEARRRARRRRMRNLAGLLAAVLGALWLYSLLGGGGPDSSSAFLSDPESPSATALRRALPEELSFNADDSVVLVHRDGTRSDVAQGSARRGPNGGWQLVRYFGVQWSPDGSKLLALRYQSPRRPGISLVLVDAKGKMGPTIAQRPLDGRWSPDGSRIAFMRHESGSGRALYVASRDGRHPTRLAAHLQVVGGPAFSWSADSSELAYAGEGSTGLFIVGVTGRSAAQRVPMPAHLGQIGGVQWSPDGASIAFTSGRYACCNVFVVHPDGTALERVAEAYAFAWSPDSTLLALAGPSGGRTWANVSIARADGTGLHVLTTCACGLRGPGSSQSVAWSSDGTRIAYISGRGNTVSTIRPDGSDAAVVAKQAARGLTGTWYPSTPIWRPRTAR